MACSKRGVATELQARACTETGNTFSPNVCCEKVLQRIHDEICAPYTMIRCFIDTDASLLITGPCPHSCERTSGIAQHEHFPTSRGHDSPAVHHGATAKNPCHKILQRYLPFEKSWATAVQHCYLVEVQVYCCALCCQVSGKHHCCRESFLSDLVGRLH